MADNATVATARKRVAILLVAAALVTGCGKKLDGTYKLQNSSDAASMMNKLSGGMSLEFSGSKVTVSAAGSETEGTYEIDGEDVKIAMAGQASKMILKLDKDGCLADQMVGRFCKV